MMTRWLLLLLLVAVPLEAAEYSIRGKKLLVRNPSTPEARKVIIFGSESDTDLPLLSDLEFGQNTLRIFVNGATPSEESYSVPGGGWQATPMGFRWADPNSSAPLKKIVIKRTSRGRAALLVRLELSSSPFAFPVSIVPPNPGTGGGIVLVTSLNTYCVTLGDASGGRFGSNTAQIFQVTHATSQPGCPPPDPRCCQLFGGPGLCGWVPWPSLCLGTVAPSGYSCDSVTGTCVPGAPSPGACYEGCGQGIFPLPLGCAAGPTGCFATPVPNAICTPTGCASPSGAFLASTDGS